MLVTLGGGGGDESYGPGFKNLFRPVNMIDVDQPNSFS
jgi:hypothetical protein